MLRKEIVFQHIDRDGYGVEIGPSHNPIAPKKEGYKVHIIDHMSRDGLILKYKDHHVNLENIEEVDFVWQGESYAKLTGKNKYYDWIIASHVIEHTPDLIEFLNDCDSILKDSGVISLVIPDKRFCFDHFRPITGISKIIDSHLQKNIIHTPGTVAEYFLNTTRKDGELAWYSSTAGPYEFIHTLEHAQQGMKSVIDQKAYLDVHAWCFVPNSFRLIIHDLFCLKLIPFQEIELFPTVDEFGFYITLGRNGKGPNQSRLEILNQIEIEMAEELMNSKPGDEQAIVKNKFFWSRRS